MVEIKRKIIKRVFCETDPKYLIESWRDRVLADATRLVREEKTKEAIKTLEEEVGNMKEYVRHHGDLCGRWFHHEVAEHYIEDVEDLIRWLKKGGRGCPTDPLLRLLMKRR